MNYVGSLVKMLLSMMGVLLSLIEQTLFYLF